MNVSAEMIAQLLKRTDPPEDFGRAESGCQRGGFLFRSRDIALCHVVAGAKNVGPPGEQGFDQRGAPLQIKTFGERFIISFPFFQPGAVRRILVTRLLSL